MPEYKIGVLVGSARTGSYSQALANAAVSVMPASLKPHFINIAALPFFNQDIEDSGQQPQAWLDYRAALAASDG